MRISSLASGSKGNAYVVEHGGEALLVDCGLSCREFRHRLAATGLEPEAIVAVVFTHSHDDHVKGLSAFHRNFPRATLFANTMTAEAIAVLTGVDEGEFCCFENGQPFDVGPFSVAPFSIPHDTSDPVGFLVRTAGTTYFHGTDIGTPLDSIGLKFAEADVATLESNHDPVLLWKSGRPPSLIQRIAGERGHLSNDQACELVKRFAAPRLKRLALAHLSRDCNAPHLAAGAMKTTLVELRRTDVELKVLSQDVPVEI